MSKPIIIAHRGASSQAPENTLASMHKAIALGSTWVEFDVQLTACGEAVVIHDATLQRTTNGRGKVSQHTYAQIAELDAGSWFAPEFSGERVPTLTEVLKLLAAHRISPVIEIKPLPGAELAVTAKVMQVLSKLWPSDLPYIVSSFSKETVALLRQNQVRQNQEQLQLALGLKRAHRDAVDFVKQHRCHSMHISHSSLTQKSIQKIKEHNQQLYCFTVNDPARAQELFSWGVDGIFTDCPEQIISETDKVHQTQID